MAVLAVEATMAPPLPYKKLKTTADHMKEVKSKKTPKTTHHYRPGMVVLWEIHHYQKSTTLLLMDIAIPIVGEENCKGFQDRYPFPECGLPSTTRS